MFARMSKPYFWHEVIITLGGPLSMAGFSLALAHVIEQEEGPVLPRLQGPNVTDRRRLEPGVSLSKPGIKASNSQRAAEPADDKNGDENDSTKTMRLIFAFS